MSKSDTLDFKTRDYYVKTDYSVWELFGLIESKGRDCISAFKP